MSENFEKKETRVGISEYATEPIYDQDYNDLASIELPNLVYHEPESLNIIENKSGEDERILYLVEESGKKGKKIYSGKLKPIIQTSIGPLYYKPLDSTYYRYGEALTLPESEDVFNTAWYRKYSTSQNGELTFNLYIPESFRGRKILLPHNCESFEGAILCYGTVPTRLKIIENNKSDSYIPSQEYNNFFLRKKYIKSLEEKEEIKFTLNNFVNYIKKHPTMGFIGSDQSVSLYLKRSDQFPIPFRSQRSFWFDDNYDSSFEITDINYSRLDWYNSNGTRGIGYGKPDAVKRTIVYKVAFTKNDFLSYLKENSIFPVNLVESKKVGDFIYTDSGGFYELLSIIKNNERENVKKLAIEYKELESKELELIKYNKYYTERNNFASFRKWYISKFHSKANPDKYSEDYFDQIKSISKSSIKSRYNTESFEEELKVLFNQIKDERDNAILKYKLKYNDDLKKVQADLLECQNRIIDQFYWIGETPFYKEGTFEDEK
jgi:hypothetical protein